MLGNKFKSSVHLVLGGLSLNPYLCHNRGGGIFSVRIKGFPFSVFYCIENGYIFILSVCHERRNPRIWKSRKTTIRPTR